MFFQCVFTLRWNNDCNIIMIVKQCIPLQGSYSSTFSGHTPCSTSILHCRYKQNSIYLHNWKFFSTFLKISSFKLPKLTLNRTDNVSFAAINHFNRPLKKQKQSLRQRVQKLSGLTTRFWSIFLSPFFKVRWLPLYKSGYRAAVFQPENFTWGPKWNLKTCFGGQFF